jgi:hypothetical protein
VDPDRTAKLIPQRNISKRWFAHAATHPARVTWQDFKQQINIFSRGHSAQTRALAELASCAQHAYSVDKYITRFATLVSTALQDCAAPHIIQGFLRGMTDANLRTMLTYAPNGAPWTSLLELQNQASILAVSHYPSDSPTTHSDNKRKFDADGTDSDTDNRRVTFSPDRPTVWHD